VAVFLNLARRIAFKVDIGRDFGRVGGVVVNSSLLLRKLGDAALDGLKILNHIGIGVAFGLSSLQGLAVLGTGLVPTFDALGSLILLLISRQSIVLCLCVVSVGAVLDFAGSLFNEILVQHHARIEIITEVASDMIRVLLTESNLSVLMPSRR
jgi:hypothetical protein